MATVDERIVQMKFENGAFERNIAQTTESLTKLNSTLEGLNKIDFRGIETATESMKEGMAVLTGAIRSVDDKGFNFLETAFNTMAYRITNTAIDLGQKLANTILSPFTSAIGQVMSGGWSRATNIDKAKFQLEGLKVSWDEIASDINYAVMDTAYGLDAAATAASQLVASGVEFGKQFEEGESPMAQALRGISGVAAMTNASYEEISRVFTAVAGQGKLMTRQMRQLEIRGLNIAATMAETMGTTEAAIRDMVTKGQVDFAMFSKAMNDAFGEHATKANNTFEGSMANMKAALSRLGQTFFEVYRKNMIPYYNTLKAQFKDVKNIFDETNVYANFEDFFTTFMTSVTNFVKNIDLSGLKNFLSVLDQMYQKFKGTFYYISVGMKNLKNDLQPIKDGLMTVTKPLKLLFGVMGETTEKIEKKSKSVRNALEGIEETTKKSEGYAYRILKDSGENVQGRLSRIEQLYDDIMTSKLNIQGYQDFVKKIADGSSTQNLRTAVEKVNKYSQEALPESVAKFYDNAEATLKHRQAVLEGLDKVADEVIAGTYGEGEDRITLLTKLFGSETYKKIQNLVNQKLGNSFKYDGVTDDVEELGDGSEKTGVKITNLEEVIEHFSDTILKVRSTWSKLVSYMTGLFSDEEKAELIENFFTIIGGYLSKFRLKIEFFTSAVSGLAGPLRPIIINAVKLISGFFSALNDFRTLVVDTLKDLGVFDAVETIVEGLATVLANLLRTLADSAHFWTPIKDVLVLVSRILIKVKEHFVKLYEAFKNTTAYSRVLSIFGKLKTALDKLRNSLIGKLIRGLGKFKDYLVEIYEKLSGEYDYAKIATDISDSIEHVIDVILSIPEKISDFFNFESLNKNLLDMKANLDDFVYTMTGGLLGNKKSPIGELTDELSGFKIDGIDNVIDKIKELGSTGAEGVQDVVSSLGALKDEGLAKLLPTFETLKSKGVDGVDEVIRKLKTLKDTGAGSIEDLYNSVKNLKFEGVDDTLKQLKELSGIDTAIDSVKSFDISKVIGSAVDKLKTLKDVGINGLDEILKRAGAFDGVEDLLSKVEEVSNNNWNGFNDLITRAIELKYEGVDSVEELTEKLKSFKVEGINTEEVLANLKNFKIGGVEDAIDALKKLRNDSNDSINIVISNLKEAGGSVVGYSESLGKSIFERLKTFIANYKFGDITKLILQGLHDALFGTAVSAATLDGAEAVEEVVDSPTLLESVTKAFTSLFDGIKSIGGAIKGFFDDNIKPVIYDFLTWVNPLFDGTFQSLMDTIDMFWGAFVNFKITKSVLGIFGNFNDLIKSLNDSVKTIPDLINSVKGVFSNFSGVLNTLSTLITSVDTYLGKTLKSVRKYLRAKRIEAYATSILKVAIAVGVLAASFWALGQMDVQQIENARSAFIVIGGVLLVIALVLKVVDGLLNKYKGSNTGLIPPELLKSLDGLANSLKNFLKKIGNGALILLVALAIGSLANTVIKLSKIDFDSAMIGVLALQMVILLMVEALLAVKAIEKYVGGDYNAIIEGIGLWLIAAAINKAAKALISLSKLNEEQVKQGTKSLFAVTTALSQLSLAMADYKITAGGASLEKSSSIQGVIGLVVLLALVGVELVVLSAVPANKLKSATNSLTTIINAISLLFLMNGINQFLSGNGVSILESLVNGMGLIVVTLAAICLATKAMLEMHDDPAVVEKAANSISNIMNSISLMIAAIAALKFVEGGGLFGQLKGINVAGLLSSGGAATASGGLSALAPVAGTIGIVAVVLAVLAALNQIPLGEDGFVVTVLGEVEKILGAIASIIGTIFEEALFKPLANALGLDQLGNNITKFIEVIMPLLSGEQTVDTSFIDSLGDAFGTLAKATFWGALTSLFSKLNDSDEIISAVECITSVASKIKDYADISVQINADAITSKESCIDTVLDIFNKVKNAVQSGVFDNLTESTSPMISFANKMVEYSGIIKGVKSKVITKTSDAIKGVIEYTNLVPHSSAIKSFLVGEIDLKSFGESIIPFANSMVEYSSIMAGGGDKAGFNANLIKSTRKAVQTIIELTKETPKQGGLLQAIMGNQFPSDYGSKLVGFAEGLVSYSGTLELGKFNANLVESTKSAVSMLIELTKEIPKSGGIFSWLNTNNDADKFGKKLKGFASGLVAYIDELQKGEFDAAYLDSTNVAIDGLISICEKIPRINGLVENFVGTVNPAIFGQTLTTFGSGVLDYVESLKKGKLTKVQLKQTNIATEILKKVMDAMPQSSFDTSADEMTKIGQSFSIFGKAVYDYCTYVTEAPIDDANDLFDTVGKLIINYKDLLGQVIDNQTLVDLGAINPDGSIDPVALHQGYVDLADEMLNKVATGFETSLDQKPDMKNVGYRIVHAITDEIKSDESVSGFESAIVTVLSKSVDSLRLSLEQEDSKSGKTIITALLRLVNDMVYQIEKTNGVLEEESKELVDNITEPLKIVKSDTYDAGKNAMLGLRDGINNNSIEAKDAMTKVGGSLVKRLKAALDEHSPSRETYWVGLMAMLGIANALKQNQNMTDSAAASVGYSMLDSMSYALNETGVYGDSILSTMTDSMRTASEAINYALNDNLEMRPTITPVVDMSNIDALSNSLEGMNLGTTRLAMTGLQNAGYTNQPIIVSYDDSHVLSAINSLEKRIANLGESMSQMGIVIDGDGLVASISGRMDTALGSIKMLNARYA